MLFHLNVVPYFRIRLNLTFYDCLHFNKFVNRKKITSKKENVQNIFIIGSFYTMKLNKLVAYLSERTKFYGRQVDTRLFTIFLMVLFKCILGIEKRNSLSQLKNVGEYDFLILLIL